ncbi:MAG: nucleoside triphosphate pyrophosphohydrolase [Candidatus Dependentiae bacterium]|nr:nucleoside triphosphate pyrophosphohydrolase [Candidatus Dependentiae bacterium]
MNLRTFKHHKLWRDKMVNLVKAGTKAHWISLNDLEFKKQLKLTLIEKAHEAQHADCKQSLMEELVDALEVIDAMCQAHGISAQELMALKKKKRETSGGFDGKTFVTFVEYQKDSVGEKICLENPDKYPEIKN